MDKSFKNNFRIEIKYIAWVIGLVIAVAIPFYKTQQDVALIKQNHYAHIETLTNLIECNNKEINELQARQLELMEVIIANQTKLTLLMK